MTLPRLAVLLLLIGAAHATDTLATSLRVTELMYHGANATAPEIAAGGLATPDDSYDYIELQNIGSTTLDLSGVHFIAVVYVFPAGYQLLPGAYVVVAKDLPSFTARYGAGLPVVGPF